MAGPSRPRTGWERRDLLWLAAITAVATALRFAGLAQWSLGVDEGVLWRAATEPLAGPGGFLAGDRIDHPLPALLLRILFETGALPFHGEGWLRLPFVFCGIVAVPLSVLAAELWVGRRTALVAGGLLALHPLHVQASQSATGHAPMLVVVTLAHAAVWVGRSARHRALLGIAAALALLAGLFAAGGWVLCATWVGAYGLARLGGAERRVTHAAVAALAVPVAATTVAAVLAPAAAPVQSGLGIATGALAVLGAATWFVPGRPGWPPVGAATRLRFLVLAAVLPWLHAAVRGGGVATGLDAVVALPAWLALAAAGAVASHALIARGLQPVAGGLRAWLPLVVAAALFVELAVGTVLQRTVHQGGRPPWREACRLVQRSMLPGDTVVWAGEGLHAAVYYLRPGMWSTPTAALSSGVRILPVGPSFEPAAGGAKAQARGENEGAATASATWLLATAGEAARWLRDAEVGEVLRTQFELVAVVPATLGAGDGGVWLWRRVGR